MNDIISSKFWIKDKKLSFENLTKLNEYRRSISNFVKILTNKNIPIEFCSSDNSYTDGETIVIDGSISETKFDSVVGLALHEASHIILSDFSILKNIEKYYTDTNKTYISDNIELKEAFLNILNIIEDRRVDCYIKNNAPGYAGYYISLYNRYFLNDKISKIVSDNNVFCDETLESYMFRFCNLINKNSSLTALKEIKNISNVLDVKNINRLKNTIDSVDLTNIIFSIILQTIDNNINSKTKPKNNDSDENENENENNTNENSNIDNIINEIKKFISGKTDKTKLSKEVIEQLNKIKDINATIKKVNTTTSINKHSDSVIFIKSVNITDLDNIGIFKVYTDNSECITSGLLLGKQLLKKLIIRNDINITYHNRKDYGKLDKKQLHSVSYNNNVFIQSNIELYSNTNIHISIDVSGSMAGLKLKNTIKTVTAITYACSKLNNVSIQISLRNSTITDNYICLIYDSKKDKFSKLQTILKTLTAMGGTPEGLCFEAIKDHIIKSNYNNDNNLFINFSDGEPSYENGLEHTKTQINNYKKNNINVISYFIADKLTNNEALSNFKYMYGNSAKIIDVHNITDIAKSINVMLLQK